MGEKEKAAEELGRRETTLERTSSNRQDSHRRRRQVPVSIEHELEPQSKEGRRPLFSLFPLFRSNGESKEREGEEYGGKGERKGETPAARFVSCAERSGRLKRKRCRALPCYEDGRRGSGRRPTQPNGEEGEDPSAYRAAQTRLDARAKHI